MLSKDIAVTETKSISDQVKETTKKDTHIALVQFRSEYWALKDGAVVGWFMEASWRFTFLEVIEPNSPMMILQGLAAPTRWRVVDLEMFLRGLALVLQHKAVECSPIS